ncbi:cilia- and flagella-associated protein 100 [Salmo salar]|uniref:Cilia- and flagella-associated protein 100 n=1 Tax=Salmo salar TaxID=8030 RepID=A0A1S3P7D3_SALSA|nr:cilia- and flagella-associated protein 100 [Salmo salar]|eukprot:XP_014023517.1 PREDICTED: coiled-coil domain-containing protein 37-like isoform X1 [Salmo salar]
MLSPASRHYVGKLKPRANPFEVLNDNIFPIRKKEKESRKLSQLGLQVHEKVTYAGRMKAKQADLRRKLREELEEEDTAQQGGEESRLAELQNTPAWRAAMIKDCNIDKESINDFINQKKEMFLLEYSLAVKRGEIEQLEKVAAAEERKLTHAEQFLEDDAIIFDQFLKENDKNSVEAIKVAELETKVKMEKMSEIKRITTRMVTIKSDISKFEDIMKEFKMHKEFLFKLSPLEWQEAHRAKAKTLKLKSATRSATKSATKDKPKEKDKDERATPKRRTTTDSKESFAGRELPPIRDARTPSRQSTGRSDKLNHVAELKTDSSEYEEDPELYFRDPRQLLELLTELEEQNLSLIQNSRETEDAQEEFRQVMDYNRKKMEVETNQLTQQIDIMTHTIHRERERAAELELRARLFNFGKYKSDDKEGMFDSLGAKVEEVYRVCVGDSEANLSTLQMLKAIESRLDELLENVEIVPKERLVLAERAKEKERRFRLRDEKMHQDKQHQEERLKRALKRAQADVKKTTGKKLMARSQRPARKLKTSQVYDISDKEKEEQLYFFT